MIIENNKRIGNTAIDEYAVVEFLGHYQGHQSGKVINNIPFQVV